MKKNRIMLSLTLLFLAATLGTSIVLMASFLAPPSHTLEGKTLVPSYVDIWGGAGEYVAKSVAVDDAGNIYVTGYFNQEVGDDYDVFVKKYASDLTPAWNVVWGDDFNDHGEDIAIDSEGNVIVVGGSQSLAPGLSYRVFVAKFNPLNGNLIKNVTKSTEYSEYLRGVDIGPDGRIYTCGEIYYPGAAVPAHYDALYIIWHGNLSGPDVLGIWNPGVTLQNDRAYDIKATKDWGFVIVGETESVGAGLYDGFVALYDWQGTLVTNKTWGGTVMEAFRGVVIEEGTYNIYVAGQTNTGHPTGYVATLLRYDGTLNILWNATYDKPSNDWYDDVCIGADGYIYTAGYTYNATTLSDTLIVKHNSAGTMLDNGTWVGPDSDPGYGIIGRSGSEIFICGGTNFIDATPLTFGDAFLLTFGVSPPTTPTTTPTTPITSPNTTTPTTPTNTTPPTTPTGTSGIIPAFTFGTVFLGVLALTGVIVLYKRRK